MKKLYKYTTTVYIHAENKDEACATIFKMDPREDWIDPISSPKDLAVEEVKDLADLAHASHQSFPAIEANLKYSTETTQEIIASNQTDRLLQQYNLYKVTVEYTTVIAAPDYVSAQAHAEEALNLMFLDECPSPSHVCADKIHDAGELPDGWAGRSLPYGNIPEELLGLDVEDYLNAGKLK